MDESQPKTESINCPFLKMVQPDTSSIFTFASSCQEKGGMQYMMAMFICFDVTRKQKGFWKALLGHTPDLYALNQVEGISHPDKYSRYMDKTEEMIKTKSNPEGMVSLQDLVDIKKWVAEQEKIEIGFASKSETVLVFIKSGGDLDTGVVKGSEGWEVVGCKILC